MSDFQKDFLHDFGRLPGQAPEPRADLGALGKHPGWDDHIEGLLDTATLALFKNIFYIQGLGREIDSGAWDRPELAADLIGFDHYFLWVRGDQFLLGRLWSSSDGRGRTKYPMILCVHCSGLPMDWALQNILPELDQTREDCQKVRTAGQVRQMIQKAQADLKRMAATAPNQSNVGQFVNRAAFLAGSELGPDLLGLKRILHELEANFLAYKKSRSGKAIAPDTRAQHIRVPRNAPSPAAAMLAWKEFLDLWFAKDLPLLLVAPAGKPWVDICAGEPSANEMFPLRVQSVGLASSVPYQIGPQIETACAELAQQFETGVVSRSLQTQSIKKHEAQPNTPKETWDAPAPAKRLNLKWLGLGGGGAILLLLVCLLWPRHGKDATSNATPSQNQAATSPAKPPEQPSPAQPPPDMTAPVAVPKTLQAMAGNATPLRLEGTDPKGRPVTFQIVSPPTHGRLSGDPPNLSYLADSNYSGPDSITFKAVRDKVVSEPAAITIRVLFSLQAPTLSPVPDQAIEVGDKFKPMQLTVNDDKTPPEQLKSALDSSDTEWLPVSSIKLDRNGGSWAVRIDPVPSRVGSAELAVIAIDGDGNSATNHFRLTIRESSWQPPTLELVGPENQVAQVGSPIPPVVFRASDRKSSADRLAWSFSSSNPALLPEDGVRVRRDGDVWQVMTLPAAGKTGTATVTVILKNEGGLSTTNKFALEVHGAVSPPRFDQPLGDVHITQGQTFQGTVKISDAQIPAPKLKLKARVEPLVLVALNLMGDAQERTVELSARDSVPGHGKLILELSNGETNTTIESAIEVLPPESPLFVTVPPGPAEIPTGKASPPIEFVISNRSGPADQIHFSVTSQDQKAIPNDHLAVSREGSIWRLIVTPNDGAAGQVDLMAVAVDAFGTSATNVFQVAMPAPSKDFRNALGMEFVWVDDLPGTGQASWDATHQHGAWVGKYLVTQKDFAAVMHTNPSGHKAGDLYPVENMTAADVDEFCRDLPTQDQNGRPMPSGWSYQLLTLEQWKKCAESCRDADCVLSKPALRRQNTEPVNSLAPNALGLFDVVGNLCEVVTLGPAKVKWLAGASFAQSHSSKTPLQFNPGIWAGFRIAITPTVPIP